MLDFIQEAEKLTVENSRLIEENKDLHRTVEALQNKVQQIEASLEEKNMYLVRLAEEMTKRENAVQMNERLLTEANQRVSETVCVFMVQDCTCTYIFIVLSSMISFRSCSWSSL